MYIIIILFIGLLLRLISLNQSLWLDEATTALVAKISLSDIFTKFLPGDVHPPLYYLIIKYWTALFGTSEIALRVPSILFGLGTIYFTYLIGRKIFNEKTGLLASALLATSGLAIYYSQEARLYSLAAFLVSVAFYLFLEKKWLVFAIVLTLIGMTDYVALFIIPVFFVIGWKHFKKIALSLIPLAMVFIFWLPIFVKQILAGLLLKGSDWWNLMGSLTYKNLALIPVKFILGRISFDNKILFSAIVVIGLLLFGLILIKSLKVSKILWMWLILPVVIGIFISFKVPALSYFRYLFCLTPFYLLLAYGAKRFGKIPKAVIILLILINLATSGYYLASPKFQREDWRGAATFVESKKSMDSIIIFPRGINAEAYLYYAPDAKIAGPEGIRAGYNQIWLMDYLSSVFDQGSTAKSKVEALGYVREAGYTFRGVGQINLYESRY